MPHTRHHGIVSENHRKHLQKYLSEDEYIHLLSGLSTFYLTQRFIRFLILPFIIFNLLALLIWVVPKAFSFHLILFTSDLQTISPLYFLYSALFLTFITALIRVQLLKRSILYILTNKRVVIKRGLLSIALLTAPFDKITQIEIDQSILDRMLFKHGTIRLSIAGLDHKEIDIAYIDSPLEFKNILERLIHLEKDSLDEEI